MRVHRVPILVVGVSLSACSDPAGDLSGGPVGPSTGTLVVSTSTVGDDPDPDGYQLTVNDAESLELSPTGTAEVDLPAGRHTLRLLGVARNCQVTPGTQVEVDVPSGTTTPVAFEVSCLATGASITVTTTGLDLDPDGYRVIADGSDRGAIASNGTVFIKLDPGSRRIGLGGLASNCVAEGSGERRVNIEIAKVTPIGFVVVCTEAQPLIGFIWGQVLGESGCIRGAMVEIVAGPGMGRKSGQPDPPLCDPWGTDGFRLDHLPVGATVTLRATASGYQPEDSVVVVRHPAFGVSAVQFRLQPSATFKRSIAFESSGDIYLMKLDGSNPVNLTKTGSGNFDPAWSADGTRIAFARFHDIFVMNADGSNPVNLTFMDRESSSRREPTWSPDGTRIAFTLRSDIYVMNADGSNVVNLSDVILSNGTDYLFAPTFELPAWSPDGTKIAFALSSDFGYADIYVADADGSNPRNLTRSRGDVRSPAWSPDGRRIAHARRDGLGAADIYVMDADGSNAINLSNNPARDQEPSWSPDGRRIAFMSDREDSAFDIYVMDADGANQIRLTDRPGSDRSPAWRP